MLRPRIEILGAYRVDASAELLDEAMRLKFPYTFESAQARKDAEQHIRSEILGAMLLEVLVRDRDRHFRIDDFGQEGSDQAAYCEVFLSEDGNGVISNYDMPGEGPLRIAFYMHFVDPTKPLNTSYGSAVIPPPQTMPSRLKSLVPYEPVT